MNKNVLKKEYKDGNYYYRGMNIEQPIELYIK